MKELHNANIANQSKWFQDGSSRPDYLGSDASRAQCFAGAVARRYAGFLAWIDRLDGLC
jgi:hypothetical protein